LIYLSSDTAERRSKRRQILIDDFEDKRRGREGKSGQLLLITEVCTFLGDISSLKARNRHVVEKPNRVPT
jgi:hypothetical protein